MTLARFFRPVREYFFGNVPATGFGMLRMVWGATVFVHMLSLLPDVTRIYSNAGIYPTTLEYLYTRNYLRFTIFEWITEPSAVLAVYVFFLMASLCMALGIVARISTIISVVIFLSLNERAHGPLSGGDTVLRLFGCILMISPGIHAVSLKRLRAQWRSWKDSKTLLPPMTMPVWPVRLLTWQYILIYATAGWAKLYDPVWRAGTAVGLAVHHVQYTRWARWVNDLAAGASKPFTYLTILFEGSWSLLLIPRTLWRKIGLSPLISLRLILIFLGTLFHAGIFLLFDVGIFSVILIGGYVGLLREREFVALRSIFGTKKPIAVLYDGHCRLCRRSVFTLLMLDWFKCLKPADITNPSTRRAVAPGLHLTDLLHQMHIRLPNGRTKKGFAAFRALARRLPLLWPILPILWLPGMNWLGQRAYLRIAKRRKRCVDGSCAIH